MRLDIPLRFVPDVSLREAIRTMIDLEDMDMEFDLITLDLDRETGAFIDAYLPEERWPEVRAYIEAAPAVEIDEETLWEWADEPDTEVIE